MKKDDPYKFEQKKINHVFHYTNRFEFLEGIIMDGFKPSYCKEQIEGLQYLSPMVSFCNIPIGEVDKYARYGKNGIGMSMEWAIENKINPVQYIHKGSKFINILHVEGLFNETFNNQYEQRLVRIAIDLLQNIKYWKTIHKGKEINTYQEREWRYVPDFSNSDYLEIIDSQYEPHIKKYDDFCDEEIKPKPHFPEFALEINKISDINYIVVTTELQRRSIIKLLENRFGEEDVFKAIINGKLSILTASQIRNDF